MRRRNRELASSETEIFASSSDGPLLDSPLPHRNLRRPSELWRERIGIVDEVLDSVVDSEGQVKSCYYMSPFLLIETG